MYGSFPCRQRRSGRESFRQVDLRLSTRARSWRKSGCPSTSKMTIIQCGWVTSSSTATRLSRSSVTAQARQFGYRMISGKGRALLAGFWSHLTLHSLPLLREQKYWVLKVHVHTLKENQEIKVFRHIAKTSLDDHSGREYIRRFEDSFKLKGPCGEHDVLVMAPLGMSLRTLQEMQENLVFQQNLVLRAIDQVLLGLDFLHEADVIHTGRTYLSHPRNCN